MAFLNDLISDDFAAAAQHKNPKFIEHILSNDAATLGKYYKDWRLGPNPQKTEVSNFSLNNRAAIRDALNECTILWGSSEIQPEPNLPRIHDRSNTFRKNLSEA